MLRLFVALDLPDEIRAALAALTPDPETWRVVRPEALHVTLAFLGSRPEEDVERIRPVVEAERAAPLLALERILLLPPRRARVLTVALADPTGALARQQARISGALEAAGVYTPEKRPYRAHVTLARLKPRVLAPRAVNLPLEPRTFRGAAVTLYVSRLHASGARYDALARASLGYIQP